MRGSSPQRSEADAKPFHKQKGLVSKLREYALHVMWSDATTCLSVLEGEMHACCHSVAAACCLRFSHSTLSLHSSRRSARRSRGLGERETRQTPSLLGFHSPGVMPQSKAEGFSSRTRGLFRSAGVTARTGPIDNNLRAGPSGAIQSGSQTFVQVLCHTRGPKPLTCSSYIQSSHISICKHRCMPSNRIWKCLIP